MSILLKLVPLEGSWHVGLEFDNLFWFVDVKVGRVEDEAVGRDLVAWLQLNDVSDDEIPDGDGLHRSFLASEDRDTFLTVLALELNKLAVLAVVVPGCDEDLDAEGD